MWKLIIWSFPASRSPVVMINKRRMKKRLLELLEISICISPFSSALLTAAAAN